MALDKATAGLTFTLDANSQPATATLNSFKDFFSGLLEGLKGEAQSQFQRIADQFRNTGAAADSATKPTKGFFDTLRSGLKGDIEGQLKGLTSGLGGAGDAVVGLATGAGGAVLAIAGLGAGIAALAAHAANADEKIFDLTQKTNFSAQSLAAMKLSADTAGTSIDQVVGFIDRFQRSMAEANAGSKPFQEIFKKLGIDTVQGVRDSEAAFSDFTKKLNQLSDDAGKIDLLSKLGGRGAVNLLQFFKDGSAGIQGFLDKAKELGIALPDAFAAGQADKFNDTLTNIRNQFSGLATTVGRELLPVIQPLLDTISQGLAGAGNSAQEFGQSLADALQYSINLGGDFVVLAESIGRALVEIIGLIDKIDFGAEETDKKVNQVNDSMGLLRETVYFVAGGFSFIGDVVRLTGDLIVGVIKQIALAIDQAAAGILSIFGITSDTISREINRLRGDMAELNADFDKGLKLTKQLGEAAAAARGQAAALAGGFAETEIGPDGRVRPKGTANVRTFSPPTITGERFTPPARAGRTKTGDQAATDALKLLKLQEQAAAHEADEEIKQAQRAFQFKQITIEQLTNLITEAEKKKLAAQEATFAAERAEIEKSKLRQGEKTTKLAEVAARERAAQDKATDAIQKAQDNRTRIEQAIFEQAAKARADRQESALRDEIARIQAAADQRIITEETAARRINDVEQAIFEQRRIRLVAEKTLAAEGSLEKQKAADELAKLEQDRAAQVEAAQLRILEAQRRDLANLRTYLEQRNKLLEDIRKGEIDSLNRRAAQLEQRAQNSPQFQDQAREARQAALLAEESFLNDQNQARIRAAQADAERTATTEAQKLEIRRDANKLLEQEEQRHQDATKQIQDNARVGELQQQGFDGGLAASIAEQESLVGRQLSLMETLKLGAQQLAADLQASLGGIAPVFVQMEQAISTALADTVAAFVAGKATIREAAAALYAAALQPLKDYLLKKARTQFALGVADLADLNFAGAAKHFLAGAALSAAAGLIGAGGSAIAGGGATAPSVSGGGGGSNNQQQNQPRTIDQDSFAANQARQQQVIVIRTEVGEGTVVKHWMEDYRGNGPTRALTRRDVLGES